MNKVHESKGIIQNVLIFTLKKLIIIRNHLTNPNLIQQMVKFYLKLIQISGFNKPNMKV